MKEQTAEVLGHAQQQAASIVGMASQQATSQLGMRKDLAATTVGAIATALHEASRQLEQQDETGIAGYVDTAAGQVEQLATTLREQDVNQLINTTAQFARRQPALFLAGAFALGFIGTRFLKSTSPSRDQSFASSGYGMSSDWGRSRGDAYGPGSWSGDYGTSSGMSGGGYSGIGESGSFAGAGHTSDFNSGIGSSNAMGSAEVRANSGFSSGSGIGSSSGMGSSAGVGSSDSMGAGSGTESSSGMSSGRQEGFSGAAGTRSGSDWPTRESAGLGSEGS